MNKRKSFKVTLLEESITFDTAFIVHLDQQSFGDVMKFFFNISNRSLFFEYILIEVLDKELRKKMEIFFIVLETFLDEMINCINIFELKLILVSQPHNLQHLTLHHFLMINRLLALVIVELLEGRLIVLQMTFKFLSDNSILPPILSLPIELINSIPQKTFVRLRKIIVISW